jgi:hypothetical protein
MCNTSREYDGIYFSYQSTYFYFRILPVDQNRENQKPRGWSGKRVVITVTRSVTDMECGCFCESESELLECGVSRGEVGAEYE